MDFLKKVAFQASQNMDTNTNNGKITNGNTQEGEQTANTETDSGIIGKLNGVLGGGTQGEKKEDVLDKAIDFVQERVFKMGSQDNESAVEQATDNQIASAIRSGYKTISGKEFPIADK